MIQNTCFFCQKYLYFISGIYYTDKKQLLQNNRFKTTFNCLEKTTTFRKKKQQTTEKMGVFLLCHRKPNVYLWHFSV